MSDLVGAWSLLSYDALVDGDVAAHPFGRADGRLIYTSDGHMSASLMRADRAPLGSLYFSFAPEAARAEAAKGYLSYAGRYELEGDDVLHHVEVSLFPDWIGQTLRRHKSWRGRDELTLATPSQLTSRGQNRVHRVQWRRIKD